MGAIVGDILHNLRAALDLAACDLVRWQEGADAKVGSVCFPFCRSADQLETTIRTRQFHRAGTAAVDIVRDLKPYPEGNSLLRAVHDLDIQDKHTTLIPALVSVGSPIIRRWDDDGTINPTLIGDPSAPTELRVVFPNTAGPLAGNDMVETLHACVDLTVDIIERFISLTRS